MKKVLIIDDEKRIIAIYVRMFVSAGFIVRHAHDAQSATNIIIREDIHLILLDVRMPLIDGLQMFDIIKEYNPQAKVIVSSVYPIDQQKQMSHMAIDYYDK